MEDLHEFFAGDGLFLNKECRNLVQRFPVLCQEPFGLCVRILQNLHDFPVYLCRHLITAVEHSTAGQILVLHCLQTDQAKLRRHAVLGDHGPGNPGGFLNIVGCAGGYGVENDLLCRTACHKFYQHRTDFFLRVQIFLFLRHVHDVAQRAHGTGHNGDLLYRLGILLQSADQRMSHFMIGNDAALFLAEDPVFFLFTHKNDFHSLKQILLGNHVSSGLDCQNGRLVDHVCQIGTHSAAGCQGNGFQIDGLIQMYVLGMHFQDVHTALQIRLVHDDSPVKTARTKQCLIQHLRPVGGRQNEQTLGRVKTIHLGQQLVQRLFPLIIAAAKAGIPAFADGIDLVDKNNTGCHFLGFLKQVADTGCAHADEHFHKIRTGQGEEGHVCLSCHRLGQQRLTGSRRAHQQGTFGQLGADLRIFSRIVQEIHHFL